MNHAPMLTPSETGMVLMPSDRSAIHVAAAAQSPSKHSCEKNTCLPTSSATALVSDLAWNLEPASMSMAIAAPAQNLSLQQRALCQSLLHCIALHCMDLRLDSELQLRMQWGCYLATCASAGTYTGADRGRYIVCLMCC